MYDLAVAAVVIPLATLTISLYLDIAEIAAMGAWKAYKKASDIAGYLISVIRHNAIKRKSGAILRRSEQTDDRIQKAVMRARVYAMLYDAEESQEAAWQKVLTPNKITWRLWK